jgi:uncharacterized protein (DUF305 family)
VNADSHRGLIVAIGAVVAALAIGVTAGWLVSGDDDRSADDFVTEMPADDSAEAGFVRDMSTHHTQAVAMAEAILRRTDDPDLAQLATDIMLTQQSQIGRFGGWLDQWGLPASSSSPPMSWAPGMEGHDMSEMTMPGMADPADVAALSTLPVDQAELLFLELMTAHHLGGVAMAEDYLEVGNRPEVARMAESIVRSQTAEINAMADMLATRQ